MSLFELTVEFFRDGCQEVHCVQILFWFYTGKDKKIIYHVNRSVENSVNEGNNHTLYKEGHFQCGYI